MYKPKPEQYLLKSFKNLKAGIEIDADIEIKDGEQIFYDSDNRESKIIPHAHLTDALNDLSTDLAHDLGYDEEPEIISMNGFSIDGKGNKRNVTLKGMLETPNSKKFNIKSDKIYFVSEVGEEVEKKIDVVGKEIYQFRWEDKKAKLTMTFNEDAKSETSDTKPNKDTK